MENIKERAEVKNLKQPDEVRTFEKGRLEVFKMGEKLIGRATFEPGWKWSECVRPIAKTDTCRTEHLGYQLSGRMHVRMDDGREFDMKAGDFFHLKPGHDAWVMGDEPVVAVDFMGAAEYAKPAGGRPEESGRKH